MRIFTKYSHELLTTRDVTLLDVPEKGSPAPKKTQVTDATRREIQARQENTANDHDSEEKDSGSDEKSSTLIEVEGQSEGIWKRMIERPSVESIDDLPISDEDVAIPRRYNGSGYEEDTDTQSTSPAARIAARHLVLHLKGPNDEETTAAPKSPV